MFLGWPCPWYSYESLIKYCWIWQQTSNKRAETSSGELSPYSTKFTAPVWKLVSATTCLLQQVIFLGLVLTVTFSRHGRITVCTHTPSSGSCCICGSRAILRGSPVPSVIRRIAPCDKTDLQFRKNLKCGVVCTNLLKWNSPCRFRNNGPHFKGQLVLSFQ